MAESGLRVNTRIIHRELWMIFEGMQDYLTADDADFIEFEV
jgi:hypothetical protein